MLDPNKGPFRKGAELVVSIFGSGGERYREPVFSQQRCIRPAIKKQPPGHRAVSLVSIFRHHRISQSIILEAIISLSLSHPTNPPATSSHNSDSSEKQHDERRTKRESNQTPLIDFRISSFPLLLTSTNNMVLATSVHPPSSSSSSSQRQRPQTVQGRCRRIVNSLCVCRPRFSSSPRACWAV